MIYDDEIMGNEFTDDEVQDTRMDKFFDSVDDSDYENTGKPDSDEMKLKKSRYIGEENKYRFFSQECERYEFTRTPITFRLYKDSTDYHGIVLKELDKSHFIFLLDDEKSDKGKKMKKIDISDISIYF